MGLLTAPLALVRAPIWVGLKAAEVGLSTAAEVARIAADLLSPDREAARDFSEYRAPAQRAPEQRAPVEPDYAAGNGEVSDVEDAPPSIPDELIPDHVDEEPVLVAETAEEGAEDGAGPELTVEAPWDGYERMTAADIRDRLAAASTTVAGAVELYEASHKARRSVLDAAERAQRR
jgi:hypothetical protein